MDNLNKNIIVTGSSKGLGLEITRVLLEKNYIVYAINRTTTTSLAQLASEFPSALKVHHMDLAQSSEITSSLKKIFTENVPIAGFVNNAAAAYDDIITNLDYNRLEEMYRINVFSPQMITKFVLRNMLLNKLPGSIVHISSISVHTGYKGLAMYASTKGALEAFSKNTAREWGARGIRSNCIVGGFMETEMSSTLSDDQKQRIYGRTALKKATSKESVALAAEFLLSGSSSSITGQNIFVDNGTI